MPYTEMKRPVSVIAMVALELFYAVLGVASGLILMIDPSGGGLGFTEDILDQIPFHSFFLVGLFLFTIYGLGSLLIAYGAWTRREGPLLIISRRFRYYWAWVGGMAQIGILAIWLVVEGLLIGLNFAATYFTVLIGLAILVTLLAPSTRRYFRFIRSCRLANNGSGN